jgi:hypothetical protein
MDVRTVTCFAWSLLLVVGCHKENAVTITETRPLSTRDGNLQLFATSDARFRNAKPSPVTGDTPKGWGAIPTTESRTLNFRFGPSGTGDVWVSITTGTVADHVNRWRHQFGAQPLDAAAIKSLRRIPILNTTGVWLQVQGDYTDVTGAAPKTGYGMAGVITEFQGHILSVIMLAPAAEVRFGVPALEAFVKSLRTVAPLE